MSGHSKWSNIKNRKGAQDKKRSETFTRVAKDVLTAIRMGGGSSDPEVNARLKVAIDKARQVNMPKENIERLLTRFEERKNNLVSMILEGYGPAGVPMMVEAETDNKNRTLAEIKLIFRDNEGSLGEANSVAFQFKRVGEIELENLDESKQLDLIDLRALDFEDNLVFVDPTEINKFVDSVEKMDLKVNEFKIVYRPINPIKIENESDIEKVANLVESLEDNDDVIGVFVGAGL